MTHARLYQHGVKAYRTGQPLNCNPYDFDVCSEAHEGWKEGWLDASHEHRRRHAPEAANPSRPIRVDRIILARESAQAHISALLNAAAASFC